MSPRLRRAFVGLFVIAAIVELVSAVAVIAYGPIDWHVGLAALRARDPSKSLLIAVMAASVGLQLYHTQLSVARQQFIARITGWVAFVMLVASILPLAAPLFPPGFHVSHDATAHVTYTFLFDRALSQGQFPVRWVEGVTNGLGQPLFNYYQVGFYYLVALVHAAGGGLQLSLKLTVAAVWSLGALLVFRWCRPLGALPAALGAGLFLWSPYVQLDVYVRSAYPELTAIAFVPGVLWSLNRLWHSGRAQDALRLSMFVALLLISHLPTSVIVAPLIAGLAVAGWWRAEADRRQRACLVVASLGLGLALAAFYVWPALWEIDLVKMRRLTAASFDYRQHFVKPASWFDWSWGYGASDSTTDHRMSTQIGIAQWIVLASACAGLAVPALRRRIRQPAVLFAWLVTAAVYLLMTDSRSAAIWSVIPPLAFIQFPWRLLMGPTLVCAMLSALILSAVTSRTTQGLIVIAFIAFQWSVTDDYRLQVWQKPRLAMNIDDWRWPATAEDVSHAFREGAYDPTSVGDEPRPADGRWTLLSGAATVSPQTVSDTRLTLEISDDEPSTLSINDPSFPDWRVTLDDQAVTPAVQSVTGYLLVTIPPGRHTLTASFERSGARRLAETVSSLSVLLWIGLATAVAAKQWRERNSRESVTTRGQDLLEKWRGRRDSNPRPPA